MRERGARPIPRRSSLTTKSSSDFCRSNVREGFARLDGGEIDAFDLDHVIYRYTRAAKELWKFCGNGGSRIEWAAAAIEFGRQSGTEPDWWEIGDPDRRRRVPDA